MVLEHQAHAPPVHGYGGLVGPAQQHPAGGHLLESGDDPQQRGLAASARPQHAHDLVLGDREVHAVQGVLGRALTEADRYPFQLKQCHQNSPEVLSGRSRSSNSRDTAHTSIRIVLRAIACP